jgi:hypothetical protein
LLDSGKAGRFAYGGGQAGTPHLLEASLVTDSFLLGNFVSERNFLAGSIVIEGTSIVDLRHRMNYVNRAHLHLGRVAWSVLTLSLLGFPRTDFAEDPIVVHYSDPSLTRLEAQIGVSAAQKDRFEDIVVQYRDSLNSAEANISAQGAPRSSKHGGGRGSGQNSSDQSDALPRHGKEKVSREELDELATILTPAQIKKFQDLNNGTIKKQHSS